MTGVVAALSGAPPLAAALDLCRKDEAALPDGPRPAAADAVAMGAPVEWRITGSDALDGDSFGRAVALRGDLAAVGAPGHDGGMELSRGAVYLFEREEAGGAWLEVAELLADNPSQRDYFGSAVAVGEGVVAVSAPWKDELGVVYVFEEDPVDGSSWRQAARLSGIDAGVYKEFGLRLAIDRDTLIIAAGGSVYVHERDEGGPGAWGEVAEVTPLDGHPTDYFGWAVAVSGDLLAVGAPCHDATGDETGAVYLFERNLGGPDRWLQSGKLVVTDIPDFAEFGWSLALENDTLVAGAVEVVRVYGRDATLSGGWRETAQVAIDSVSDYFGENVALEGDRLAISAYKDDEGAENSGAIYVFERDAGGPGAWGQTGRLKQTDPMKGAGMGTSLALSGSVVLAGAPAVAGPDVAGTDPGAAHLFQLNPLLLVSGACPGEAVVELDAATPGADVVLVAGERGSGEVRAGPCAGAELAIASSRLLGRLVADPSGSAVRTVDLPPAACRLWLQAIDAASCDVSNPARLP